MAIGKSEVEIEITKLSIKFGNINIVQRGKLNSLYNEKEAVEYMKNSNIEININIGNGKKNFQLIQWI